MATKRKGNYKSSICERHLRRRICKQTDIELLEVESISARQLSQISYGGVNGTTLVSHCEANALEPFNEKSAHSEILEIKTLPEICNETDLGTHLKCVAAGSDVFADSVFANTCSEDTCMASDSDYVNYAQSVCERNLETGLTSWALDYNVSHAAVTSLLKLLKATGLHEDLPTDARSLLATPRTITVNDLGTGKYCHFGLHGTCKVILRDAKMSKVNVECLQLLICIDGLPLSRSSSSCLWPILCSATITKKVFIVGAYQGNTKPDNANIFLDKFVQEVTGIINEGILDSERRVPVRVHAVICDAPAKSFVLSVKGHSGYNSCTKCTVVGEYCERRVCFPGINFTKRTDDDFLKHSDKEHHLGRTVLQGIPHFGPVSNVPLDYMHLVCLGVVRKLLGMWTNGPSSVRLSSTLINAISEDLLVLRGSAPDDFSRKPRSLHELKHWKATEYRQFLLYSGPVVLKKILPVVQFKHFLGLHVAITILTGPSATNSHVDYAHKLLVHFVYNFEKLYGKETMSYNIHGLLHLADDVLCFGPLDTFSAFRYENYMQHIKRLIRKHEKPLEQLRKRYAEIENHASLLSKDENKVMFFNTHTDGPLLSGMQPRRQYQMLHKSTTVIKRSDLKNNCCYLVNGLIVSVQNIVTCENGTHCIIGYINTPVKCLYSIPCNSKILSINIMKEEKELQMWPVDMIHG